MKGSRHSRPLPAVLVSAAALLLPAAALGGYTAGGFRDGNCRFHRIFFWTFPAANAADNAPAGLGGGAAANWVVSELSSPAPGAVGGPRDLTVKARHLSGTVACDRGHGANGELVTTTFTGLTRPAARRTITVKGKRIPHGNHADFITTAVKVPKAKSVTIIVQGQHTRDRLVKASFKNNLGVELTVSFYPTYRTPGGITEGDEIPAGTAKSGLPVEKDLPTDGDGRAPTDYRVVASGSATTDTTLTFLGELEGVPGLTELELAPMIELLGTETLSGTFEIRAPMLRDPAGLLDLFVFVDLTRWVGTGGSFQPLDDFEIAGGVHEDLPGYFVSTTPITLHADGSLEGTPFTGDVVAGATIDGASVSPTRDTCAFGPQPAATLLYPYFEVDLADPFGRNTLLSVNNAAEVCTLARLTTWTDLAVPTLTFHVLLSPGDVQTLNLRDVFNGVLPQTASVLDTPDCGLPAEPICDPADLGRRPSAMEIEALRADHTGEPNPLTGDCAGTDRGDQIARGFLTVDVVPACPLAIAETSDALGAIIIDDLGAPLWAMDNHLWGEYFLIDDAENFAQSEPAVHILADPSRFTEGSWTFYGRLTGFDGSDARVPLGGSWATRFLSGGPFDGGTDLLVWREPPAAAGDRVACGTLPLWAPLGQTSIQVFDEEENAFQFGAEFPFPLATQRVALTDLVPVPFGWMNLDLSLPGGIPAQAWVTPVMSALGRFGVAQAAARLDDLCDVRATAAPPPVE